MAARNRPTNKAAMKAYSGFIAVARQTERKKLKPWQPDFVYYEWHHVYPACLTVQDSDCKNAKDDRKQNKVLLTFPEHVQAHILLAKIYCRHYGLQVTPCRMLTDKKGQPVSIETAATAKAMHTAASSPAMSRLQLLRASQGLLRLQTLEGAAAQSLLANKMADEGILYFQTAEGMLWCSEHSYAKTDAGRQTMSNNGKLQATKSYQCSECCKTGLGNGFKNAHFDNCKLLKQAEASCLLAGKPRFSCKLCSFHCNRLCDLTRHTNKRHT